MAARMVRHLRNRMYRQAGRLACMAPLSALGLGERCPNRLVRSPCDLWSGDSEKGRILFDEGVFTFGGDRIALQDANWHPYDVSDAWQVHLHGFDWLRDLRALGGEHGRMGARAMVESWIDAHPGWHGTAWRADIMGRRVANWLYAYDFFGESAGEDFQARFFDSLYRQVRALARAVPGALEGVPLLYAIKGIAVAALSLEDRETMLAQALGLLDREAGRQVLSDGGPVSRNPQDLLETIRILVDIRAALRQAGYPCPAFVQHTLDRAVPALRFFRHGDRKFALFNGTQEGNADDVQALMVQSGCRAKSLSSLPHTGYQRMALGRALAVMDTGRTPSFPHDARAHAAPLAFEFSYGRERIFVNCGDHPTCPDWRDALRCSPAHNTLVLDDRNVCEIHRDGHIGRKPKTVMAAREDHGNACLVEACHDGYVPLSGITHRRRLYLADQGHDLRGEDSLTCSVGLSRSHDVAVRFHLHPGVKVSLVQDGTEALLRLDSGVSGWRFTAAGGVLSLEDSIYLGAGVRPRKTKQLVIRAVMDSDHMQIKWALRQE